jgi:hypothetical protein
MDKPDLILLEEAEDELRRLERQVARDCSVSPLALLMLAASALPLLPEPEAAVFAPQSRANRCENCAGRRSAEANYCPRCGHRRQA